MRVDHIRDQLRRSLAGSLAMAVFLAGLVGASMSGNADERSKTYSFRLTRGAGNAVCEANLKRLRAATYVAPPYCGLPSRTTIGGFETLHRKPLAASEYEGLWPSTLALMTVGSLRADVSHRGHELRERFEKSVLAWRYDPPVSLENDGHVDDVVIWQGFGADTFEGSERCGDTVTVSDIIGDYRARQVGFVLNRQGEIDELRTRALFGHPVAMSDEAARNATAIAGMATIGSPENIVKFRGQYYLEVFFDSYNGDLEGKRRGDRALDRTIALIRRSAGTASELCEYVMRPKH